MSPSFSTMALMPFASSELLAFFSSTAANAAGDFAFLFRVRSLEAEEDDVGAGGGVDLGEKNCVDVPEGRASSLFA